MTSSAAPAARLASGLKSPHPLALFSGTIVCPGQRKGTSHEISDALSHCTDRWALHFLQGGQPERRADTLSAARPPLIVAHVRAALRQAVRSLSSGRCRLPWLWTQRLAGSENIRLHLRSLRRDHESFH